MQASDAPTEALGSVSPRTRFQMFAEAAFYQEQLAELVDRAPPFLLFLAIAMTLRGLGDWFFTLRDSTAMARMHTTIAWLLALALSLWVRVHLSGPKVRRQAAALAPMFLLMTASIVYWLLARAVAIGGTFGHFTMAISLVMVLFVRAFVAPMTWKQAALAGSLLWLTYPLAWTIHRLVSGAWSMPAEPAHLIYPGVIALCVGSTSLSAIGSHVVLGLRRKSYEAREATRYHLQHKLGTGGMSDVYLARHGTLKAACAIKVCRISTTSDSEAARARFEREAQHVARLLHPNIVRVFDYGQLEDGSLYFAMEYLHGLDLMTFLRRFGAPPEERLVYWIEQVLRALEHAHAQDLLHLDLKPANLFLTDEASEPDFIKVLDFGVGQIMSQSAQRALTDIAGTPAYMAPEQARAQSQLDGRTDLYALGAVMYQLTTGRHVFEASTLSELLTMHENTQPIPLRQVAPTYSAELESLVTRLLEKAPENRFASAAAAREALRKTPYFGLWTRDRALAWWGHTPPSQQLEITVESDPIADRA